MGGVALRRDLALSFQQRTDFCPFGVTALKLDVEEAR